MSRFDLCDPMYVAYAETIYPVTREEECEANDEVQLEIHPPIISRKRGRPTMKRFPSVGEHRKKWQLTCSGCKKKGHTLRTCKHQLPTVKIVNDSTLETLDEL
ncbi:unnamed protein product [Cuscuta epithymum]|uniref:CCHC-type domain-containing protein n=1 Tax=Cuscuta epithymum TaxID=186058 RepID=A0AAV0FJ23_9ASTE|nr:unnamed protein product [Cuscuta epithymum]